MNDKYKVDEDGKAIIPDGTTIIDGFSYNESLISIVIPDGVTEIYSGAFEHCWSLESIDIPNSVTEICSEAFKGFRSLSMIEIPRNVTKIGCEAFSGCTSLSSIWCAVENLDDFIIDESTFEGVDVDKCILRVPSIAVSAYKSHPVWGKFEIF